jgi:hypothetical protein
VHLCSRALKEFSSIKTQGIGFITCVNTPCCHDKTLIHHFHGDNQNIWAITMVCSNTNYNIYVHYFNVWSNTLTNINRNMFYLEFICQNNSPPCNIKKNSSYFTLLNPFLFLFFKISHLPILQTLKLIKMPKQIKPFTFKVYLFMMNNFTKCKKKDKTQNLTL